MQTPPSSRPSSPPRIRRSRIPITPPRPPRDRAPMPHTELERPENRIERCNLRNPVNAETLMYIGPHNPVPMSIQLFDIVEYDRDICQVIDIKPPHITIVSVDNEQHQIINMTQYPEEGGYRSSGYGVRFDERRKSSAFDLPDLVLRYV